MKQFKNIATPIFLFMIFFLSSCKEEKKEQIMLTIAREGFFMVNNQAYFSDGKRFYCGFKSKKHFDSLRGKSDLPKFVLKEDSFPTGMVLMKYCSKGIVTEKFYTE